MNKSITVLGLAPMQFTILVLIIAVMFFVSKIVAGVMIIPIYFLGNKLAKETKNGNPDFLSSYQNSTMSMDSIEDNNHVMKNIIVNKNNNNG